jgi:hypothetical protein
MVRNRSISFIIHGQSNASGNVSPTLIDETLKPKLLNCNIFNLENKKAETLKVGINSFGVPNEYYDFNRSKGSIGLRYGIEIELSSLMREYYNSSINVFKYTWPSSGLNVLGNGGNWAFGSGNLMPKVANEYLDYKQKLKIRENENFLIWIQGETNIGAEVAYKTNIKNWIDAYRTTLGFNIPLIVVSLSSNQTYLNAVQLTNFKTMQNTLGGVILNNTTGVFTEQIGFIDNCYVLSQNEVCQNESGVLIHYSNVGISNIANGIFQIVKNYIIN